MNRSLFAERFRAIALSIGRLFAIGLFVAAPPRVGAGGFPDCNFNAIDDALDVQGTPALDGVRNYFTGILAIAEAFGDFNGDGHIDAAISGVGENFLVVRLNDGTGQFLPRRTYSVGNRTQTIAAGNLNGDAYDDVIVASRDVNMIQPFFGGPSGVLTPGSTRATNNAPVFIGLGRLDGDADLDLVVVCQTINGGTAQGQIFKNDGAGFFNAFSTFPATPSPTQLVIGDFTGDGIDDAIVTQTTTPTNLIAVLRNNGSGTFATNSSIPTSGTPTGAAAVDVDGDNDLDLAVVRSQSSLLQLWTNNGTGNLTGGPTFALPTASVEMTVANVRGDATPELLVTSRPGFTSQVNVFERIGPANYAVATTFPSVRFGGNVYGRDFDNDGDVDVAVGTTQSTLMVHENRGADGFGVAPAAFASSAGGGSGGVFGLAAARINGDAIPDLVVTTGGDSSSDVLRVMIGNADGTFVAGETRTIGDDVFTVQAGDIDGDLDDDIVVPEGRAGRFTIFRGAANGTLGAAESYTVPPDLLDLELADIDLDGDLDVLVASGGVFTTPADRGAPKTGERGTYDGGALHVFRNNGAGVMTETQVLLSGPGVSGIAIGHFNGDNLPDVAVALNGNGTVAIHSNAGNATFLTPTVGQVINIGSEPFGISAADFDDDGVDDLVIGRVDLSDFFIDVVTVWFGRGNGTFEPPINLSSDSSAVLDVLLVDLDLDGDQDIVLPSYATDAINVVENRRGRQFSPARGYWAPNGPLRTIALQRNADAFPDLMIAPVSFTESVSQLINASTPSFSEDLNADGIPDECQFAPGDMNCDGFVTVADIGGFVLALTNPAAYAVQYPGCEIQLADVNNDGFVTVADIGPFVLLLTGN